MFKQRSSIAAMVILSSVSSLPFAAYAQQLEEIVVTAQKKEQSLQDVPLAVTAITGEQVERQRLFNVSDIAQSTPSFALGQQSPSQPTLTIRGIGSTDREAGSDRSVVPFIDEVYIGRTSASTFDIFDVERVEVLRGPQGTLFGRNVSGGAISVTTVKPSDTFDAKAQITAGNYERFEFRGALNIPLSDEWAMRITGTATTRDGFYNNVFLGNNNVEATDTIGGRIQLRYDNRDNRRFLLSASANRENVDGLASKAVAGENSLQDFEAALLAFSTSAFPFTFPVAGSFNVENNVLGFSRSRGIRAYARYEQDESFGTFTIIPAFIRSKLQETRDLAGIPIKPAGPLSAGFDSTRHEREIYEAFSFEARLSSPVSNDRFGWVIGGYYLTEKVDRQQGLVRQANNGYSAVEYDQQADNESIAGFGQINWKFVESFELTAGARYTHDRKKFDLSLINLLTPEEQAAIAADLGRPPSINPGTELFAVSSSNTYNAFTPRVSLSWEPAEDQHLYISWARGFKSGGFDGNAASAAAVGDGFDPESVDTYEVGIKSMLFDRSMRINLAAFYSDFKDLQLRDRRLLNPNDQTTNTVVVINAAQATIKGIEAEVEWNVTSQLTVGLTGSLMQSEIKKITPNSTLILGTRLPRTPNYQFVLNASYMLLAEDTNLPVDMEFGVNYKRNGLSYFDINEQLGGKQNSYGILDARLTLVPPNSNWNIMLWGKNITDTRYFSDAQSISNGRAGFVRFGEPATYGLTFSWQLN